MIERKGRAAHREDARDRELDDRHDLLGNDIDEDKARMPAWEPMRQRMVARELERLRGNYHGVQNEVGAAAAAAPSTRDLPELASGMNYAIAHDGWSVFIRTSWLREAPTPRLMEVLERMQHTGAFSWAKPEGLRRAAQATAFSQSGPTIQYVVNLRTLAMMGLPPMSSAMVAREGDALVVALRTGSTIDEADADYALGPDDLAAAYRALEKFTGLKKRDNVRFDALTIRSGIVEIRVPDQTAERLFGRAWIQWKLRPRQGATRGDGEQPASVAHELTLDERLRIEKFFRDHLHIADAGAATRLDRTMLEIVDEIAADPTLIPAIRNELEKGHSAPAQAVELSSLRKVVDHAKYERERARLGVDKNEPASSTKQAEPFAGFDVPAHIRQQGLVLAGRAVPLSLELDWSQLVTIGKTAKERDEFEKRNWQAEVEWAFERTDVAGHEPEQQRAAYEHEPMKLDHTFRLGAGESSGIWTVHAFLRSSHLAPKHITAAIEVKTEDARMAELRDQAMGDLEPAHAQRTAHHFGIGIAHEIVKQPNIKGGGDPDADGTVISGELPKDFQARNPADRAKSRQTEIAHYKKMIAYLKRQQAELKPGYGDAVAAAEARLAQLEDADRKVTADGASGWQSFELRGTYLCRNGQVPSGALDLYASTSVVMNAASGATYRVKIRDLSNRIESDLEFNGEGESFHAALESAFVHLCKAYPEGKISVLGEDMVLDASLTAKPNGRMIGFELPTTSAWKRAKSKVFDPVVQTLANAAAMAIMVVFPPSAAAIVPMLAVADIVHNVDDMVTRRDKGKLAFKTAAIDIAAIGLDILPAARGAKFLNPSRAVIQELKGTSWRLVAFDGVNLAGQTVVMAERTRDELATIQDKQIAGLAERYRELLELESQSDNPSDPGIARKRAELDDDAKAIRDTVVTTWTHAVTNQATFFVGTRLLEPAPHAHADDAHPHTPRVREPQHDDSDAHDARRPDQRKSHEDRESDRLPRPHERDTVTPTEDRPPSAAWSTDAKPGASASPETIRVGTVKMEDHPDFKPMLDEAESKGFRIEYSFRTNVEVRHVMDPAGNLLEIRKTLRLIPGMRYLDLEHEMGHIRQLERFGSAPPPTEKKIKRGDMEVDAKGDLAQGKLTSKMDTIVEYHNRLQEYVRLAERGADSVVLGEHGQGVEGWRKWAESTGKLGYGGRMDAWAKQYFGDIPELEAKCRKLGLVLDTKTKRW